MTTDRPLCRKCLTLEATIGGMCDVCAKALAFECLEVERDGWPNPYADVSPSDPGDENDGDDFAGDNY